MKFKEGDIVYILFPERTWLLWNKLDILVGRPLKVIGYKDISVGYKMEDVVSITPISEEGLPENAMNWSWSLPEKCLSYLKSTKNLPTKALTNIPEILAI